MRLGKRKEVPSGQTEEPKPNPFVVAVANFNDALFAPAYDSEQLDNAIREIVLHVTDGVETADVVETARRYSMASLMAGQAANVFERHDNTQVANTWRTKSQQLDEVSHFLKDPSEATKIPEAPQMSEPKR